MAGAPRYPEFPTQPQLRPPPAAPCPHCGQEGTLAPAADRLTRCAACDFVLPLPRGAFDGCGLSDLPPGGPLGPGTVLRDRYRLVELLGKGTHGLSFLAHHEFLNYPCVVKVLPYRIDQASDAAVRRLRAEACAGFRVNHPNVVRVLDGDASDGIWYFVMEYVDGVDLAAARQRGVRIGWRQVVQLAMDVARGLDAIHRAGLVHRDVKPGNLILGTDAHVRVADLGVVGLLHGHPELAEPWQGKMVGTLAYAAPEVFAGDQEPGPQADLYSLGAALFELLTGALPRGESVYRTLLGSDHSPVAWPRRGSADVPGWLRAAILRLLEPGCEERFASAGALIDYLEHPAQPPAAAKSPPLSERPQPRGLVVLPLENASGTDDDDWLGQALADHLARSLSRHGAYVVSLDQFLQTLERIKQRAPGAATRQLLEAGRLSGAATVIRGTFRRSGETIELSARAHQWGRPTPLDVETVRGPLSTLADLETALYGRLTSMLGLATAGSTEKVKVSGCAVPAAEARFFTAKRAFLRGDYETAMRLGKEAIEIDPDFGEAVGFVGVCCARAGRYDQAVEYNRRQQSLAAATGDERLKVEAHANLGAMHYFRGDYQAANDCLTRAARAADGLGLTTELASIRNNLGFVLLQLGRQAEAERTYLRAIDTHKRYGALVALIGPYNGMGHVLREQQRYGEACDYFRRALALAQESDDYVNMGIAYMNLGHCALLQGRLADAKHELATALNILEKTSFWNGLARVYEYMADLNLRLRNCVEAVRCAEQRIELAQRHSNMRMESAAWRQKAEALKLAGRAAESSACLARIQDGEREH